MCANHIVEPPIEKRARKAAFSYEVRPLWRTLRKGGLKALAEEDIVGEGDAVVAYQHRAIHLAHRAVAGVYPVRHLGAAAMQHDGRTRLAEQGFRAQIVGNEAQALVADD